MGIRHDTKRCPGSGRPITVSTDENREQISILMRESRTWTTEEIATNLEISVGSAHNLLVEMEYRKIGSHWLPHELNCKQKQRRVEACIQNHQSYIEDERLIDRIIAIDETYMRSYDPQDRHMAKEWRKPGET